MTADPILTLFLPIALGIIMLGLGLSLTPADFLRVVRYPKPVLVGLVCQIVLLPLACFLIVQGFALEAALAVGMMLLAASPGGTTANLYSHLAHGDVALNITLTAVNSVIAILTMPLIVNLSLQYFMGDGQAIPLQFGKVVQVFVIVLGPVAIGMLLRNRLPAVADRLQKPVKILSALLLLVIILLALAKDWQTFVTYAPVVGLAALAFNLLSLAVGYWVPRLLRLPKAQAVAIGHPQRHPGDRPGAESEPAEQQHHGDSAGDLRSADVLHRGGLRLVGQSWPPGRAGARDGAGLRSVSRAAS